MPQPIGLFLIDWINIKLFFVCLIKIKKDSFWLVGTIIWWINQVLVSYSSFMGGVGFSGVVQPIVWSLPTQVEVDLGRG